MIRSAALVGEVTLYGLETSAGATSVFGDPIYGEDEGVTVPAFVSPLDATEDEINRDVRINRYGVIVDLDAELDGLSELDWNGKRWEVIGEPRLYSSHRGGHHYEFEIRRTEG